MVNNDYNKAKKWILEKSKDKSIKRFNPIAIAIKKLHIPKQPFIKACTEALINGVIDMEYRYVCNCGNDIICECLEDIPIQCKNCKKDIDLFNEVFIVFKFVS